MVFFTAASWLVPYSPLDNYLVLSPWPTRVHIDRAHTKEARRLYLKDTARRTIRRELKQKREFDL